MSASPEYGETVATYTAQLRGLFIPPAETTTRAATRGAGPVESEALAARAEALAESSQQLGVLTAGYLDSEDRAVREAAEVKLLAQATAEFDIAEALFEAAMEETEERRSRGTTRASRTASVARALDELATALETPMTAGVQPFVRVTRGGRRSMEPGTAKDQLTAEVDKTLKSIGRQAGGVCGRAARDLLLFDHALLVRGVGLVSRDAAEQLERAIAGLGRLAKRLASAALRLLLHAYDWVLALLGKDTEQRARAQVKKWLDELKAQATDGSVDDGLVGALLDRIYGSGAVKGDVAGWLDTTRAGADQLGAVTEAVAGLAEAYRVKAERVERFLKVVALSKKVPIVKTPQGQVVVAAVTLGLLGYILYAGYDHVDSGSAVFAGRFGFGIPSRVDGVRATVQKSLGAG